MFNPLQIRLATMSLVFCSVLIPTVPAAEPAAKNVLFIISDDLRTNSLGCYGNQVCSTPNIDRLAQQSVVFERAYCQGTVCGPSRQSLMFSKYQGKGAVNMGQHFRQNGWYSARVGKIYHMKVPGDIIAGTDGLDEPSSWTEKFNSQGNEAHTPGDYACLNQNIFTTDEANRQTTAMPHRMFVSVQYDGDGSDQPDHKSATKAIELLNIHQSKPFFLAVGLVRPHYPMVAPRQYFQPYAWQDMTLPKIVPNDLDDIPKLGQARTTNFNNPIGKYPDNQKRMWLAYYASVTFMDQQVGRIIDELDRLGLRESTAIVFCSDHGYHLGDHGFWQKGNLHENVLQVPLMIDVPGVSPSRSRSLVELADIFPTVSELAGLKQPEGLHGTSLVPVLKDPKATVKTTAMSFDKGFCVRTERFSYCRYKDGTEELYDMDSDPDQFTNLAMLPQFDKLKQELSSAADKRLASLGINLRAKAKKKHSSK